MADAGARSPRTPNGPALTVTKSIQPVLQRIGRNDVKLGHHFATCIRTGYLCAYLPDPERKPFWRIFEPARESPSSDFTVVTLVFPPEVVEAYVRCPSGRRFVQHNERERSRPHSSRRASKHLRKCRLQTARGRRSHAHEREALCRKEAA